MVAITELTTLTAAQAQEFDLSQLSLGSYLFLGIEEDLLFLRW